MGTTVINTDLVQHGKDLVKNENKNPTLLFLPQLGAEHKVGINEVPKSPVSGGSVRPLGATYPQKSRPYRRIGLL